MVLDWAYMYSQDVRSNIIILRAVMIAYHVSRVEKFTKRHHESYR